MASTGYQNRRYKVIGGKLEKSWVAPPPAGWFVEKSAALADNEKKIAEGKVRDAELAAEAKIRDDALAIEEAAAKEAAAKKKAEINAARLAEAAADATKLAEEAAARLTDGLKPTTAKPPAVETPEPANPEPEAAETPPGSAPEPEPESTSPVPMVRMKRTMARLAKSRVAIQREVAEGTFPQPHSLGNGEWCWSEMTIAALERERSDVSDAPEPETA